MGLVFGDVSWYRFKLSQRKLTFAKFSYRVGARLVVPGPCCPSNIAHKHGQHTFFFFCKTALFLCWMLCSSDTDKCSRCHVNPLVLGEEWWKLSREMLKIQVLLKESGYIWSLHVSRLNHVKESRIIKLEKKTKIDGKRNKFVSFRFLCLVCLLWR